jgi:hypothetical protein
MKPKAKRRSVSLSVKRKKPCFKLPNLVDDPILDEEIKNSFKRAFFVKDMKYSTALVHDLEECPASMNDPNLDQQSV